MLTLMPTRTARRPASQKQEKNGTKRPQGRPKGYPKAPGAGGPRRSPSEVDALTDEVEHLMLHGLSRQQVAKALGAYLQTKGKGDGLPVPLSTVDAYTVRVRDRWRENPMLAVEDERDQAVRRYKKQILRAKRHVDSARYEELLVKVTGLQTSTTILEASGPGGAAPIPITAEVTTRRDPAEMTSQARRREIAALEERRRSAIAAAADDSKTPPPSGPDVRPEGPQQEDPDPAT